MEPWQHAAFPTLVLCSAILVVKMIVVGHYTGAMRFLRGSFASPEDAPAFRSEDKSGGVEHEDVARIARAHRNDVESTLPFLAVAILFLATNPGAGLATGLFWVFTIFRCIFSIAYIAGLQPWRSLSFLVAEACLVVMVVKMAYWSFFA